MTSGHENGGWMNADQRGGHHPTTNTPTTLKGSPPMAKSRSSAELPGTENPAVGNSDSDVLAAVAGPPAVSRPQAGPPAAERSGEGKTPTPRRLSSPDIQALAKIDRILASFPRIQAQAIVSFVSKKYGVFISKAEILEEIDRE